MDAEKQKPITEEYRRNWERVYAPKQTRVSWVYGPDGLRFFEEELRPLTVYERTDGDQKRSAAAR